MSHVPRFVGKRTICRSGRQTKKYKRGYTLILGDVTFGQMENGDRADKEEETLEPRDDMAALSYVS